MSSYPSPAVKKGTLMDLLKYILSIPEPTWIDPFLVAYPRWLSTEVLFTSLESLASPMSCGLYPQLAPFLNQWVNIHFRNAFNEDSTKINKESQERIAQKVLALTNNLFKSGFEEEANRLKLTMIRVNKELSKKGSSTPVDKHFEVPKGPLKVSALSSRKVAEQLTLLESRMFKSINLSELYSRGWMKENKNVEAPYIMTMITHSTKVSHWVASLILNQKEENNRIRAIQRVITIAQHCFELKNYNAVMEIIGGLSMWTVARILKGMKIPKRFTAKMKSFQVLFDAQKNWKTYRDTLTKDKESGVPVLPYLGLYLTDIVFLEDGNPDFFEKEMNFEKIILLGQTLLSFQSFQKLSYNSLIKEKEGNILRYLTNLPSFNEEKLTKLSNDIKTIPKDFLPPESSASRSNLEGEWGDSSEVSTEEDSWSEETISENDFEDISSSSSSSNDIYLSILADDEQPLPRLK